MAPRPTSDDVISFWFGDGDPLALEDRWWTKSDAFDALCTERFGAAIDDAASGALDAWRSTPRGRLALVLLLDQMPRNVHRGTARSFAQDGKALAIAKDAIAANDHGTLDPVLASFLFMPLMHSENVADQHECIARFEALSASATTDAQKKTFANNVKFAKMHAAIVERFGRYPHRNAILGRQSTPEEIEFLKQPGSSF